MKCVCCTQENRGREDSDAADGGVEDGVFDGIPGPKAASTVGLELVAEEGESVCTENAFSELTMEDGKDLGLSGEQATHSGLALRKGGDCWAVWFCEVEFRDVAGVKVNQRPSRISEMICVLSVPPLSLLCSSA